MYILPGTVVLVLQNSIWMPVLQTPPQFLVPQSPALLCNLKDKQSVVCQGAEQRLGVGGNDDTTRRSLLPSLHDVPEHNQDSKRRSWSSATSRLGIIIFFSSLLRPQIPHVLLIIWSTTIFTQRQIHQNSATTKLPLKVSIC